MKAKKKEATPMEKLTAGYEDFIKGKETVNNGTKVFNTTITKASKKKAK